VVHRSVADLTLSPALWWIAQAAADPTGALIQYGAVGLLAIVGLLGVKILFQRQVVAYEREVGRADRLEQELRQLNTDVREQVMPALTRSTEAVSEAMRIMQTLETRR
jgi:hypothetical protein